jgi:hypothetical protein
MGQRAAAQRWMDALRQYTDWCIERTRQECKRTPCDASTPICGGSRKNARAERACHEMSRPGTASQAWDPAVLPGSGDSGPCLRWRPGAPGSCRGATGLGVGVRAPKGRPGVRIQRMRGRAAVPCLPPARAHTPWLSAPELLPARPCIRLGNMQETAKSKRRACARPREPRFPPNPRSECPGPDAPVTERVGSRARSEGA